MCKPSFPVFLLFSLQCLLLPAQSNFIPGGIIQWNGDTLRGLINYQEWDKNPREIQFRQSSTSTVVAHTPESIGAFFIDSKQEHYQSAVVSMNMEPSGTRDLPSFASVREAVLAYRPVRDTVFLLSLVKGKLNLFSFNDQVRRHFFIQTEGDSMLELLNRKVVITSSGDQEVVPLEEYKKYMESITSRCSKEQFNIKKLNYLETELVDVARRYNQCMGQISYVKPKDKTAKFIYTAVGAGYPVFRFGGPYTQSNNLSAAGSIAPILGIGGDFNFSRSRGKLGAGIEVYGTGYSFKKEGEPDFFGRKNTYRAKFGYLRTLVFFRLNLTAGKIQPYLKAGAGGSYFFKSDFYYDRTLGPDTTVKYPREMKKGDVSLAGAAGLRMKRFLIEGRYEWGKNLAEFDASELARVDLFALVFAMRLFK